MTVSSQELNKQKPENMSFDGLEQRYWKCIPYLKDIATQEESPS